MIFRQGLFNKIICGHFIHGCKSKIGEAINQYRPYSDASVSTITFINKPYNQHYQHWKCKGKIDNGQVVPGIGIVCERKK